MTTDEERKAKRRARNAKWKLENPEKNRVLRAYMAKWDLENRERRREINNAYYRRDPARNQAKMRRRTVEMTPAYLASLMGLPVAALTPEMTAIKRKQLAFARLTKQMKHHLKALNETITTNPE